MLTGSWGNTLTSPLQGRECKPRYSGLTMVIDAGIGLRGLQDVVESAASWIDFWKFGFGTSYLYSEDFLREKLSLLSRYGILAYPGGTLFEAAVLQGRADAFLEKAAEIGFRCIEISDGTIELEARERYHWIREAKRRGFVVLAETGKKRAGLAMTVERYARQLEQDLDSGADFVIVEGRESGR
ncbi:MAG: phosphosulfolactate synthase, partial [Alicyclobacillaceae bacterium]|nr:phosphosulfolactate synthase [Alicyclobacillaceae bacterium]